MAIYVISTPSFRSTISVGSGPDAHTGHWCPDIRTQTDHTWSHHPRSRIRFHRIPWVGDMDSRLPGDLRRPVHRSEWGTSFVFSSWNELWRMDTEMAIYNKSTPVVCWSTKVFILREQTVQFQGIGKGKEYSHKPKKA